MFSFLLSSRYLLKNCFIIFYVFTLILFIILYVNFRPSRRVVNFEGIEDLEPPEEVSCHTLTNQDTLPLLPRNVAFPEKSIFFHETSCKNGLTARQACVVESAARAHPGHQINVFFSSSVSVDSLQQSIMNTLLAEYKNVKVARVYIKDYAEGTPLSSTVNNLRNSQIDQHISDLMKYLTMYKYGGIYLGLDVVVAQPLTDLWKNWAIRDTPTTLSTEMFSFSENKVGRKLAEVAIGYLMSDISLKKHTLWSFARPSVLTHVLQLWCSTNKVQAMSLLNCDDLAVYGPHSFYPISFHNRAAYFRTVDWDVWKKENIYTYHVWEYFTKYNIVTKNSLYGWIAAEYCPKIFNTTDEVFGLVYR